MSITSKVILDSSKRLVDYWKFGTDIEYSQPKGLLYKHKILFNKGKYFETSIYDEAILKQVSSLTNIPIEHKNMICGKWDKMEDFVIVMNKLNYRVEINIDWI